MKNTDPPRTKAYTHVDSLSQSPDFLRGYRMALVHGYLGRVSPEHFDGLIKEIDRRLSL